jgi:endonuclease G, mitochondrial
MVSFLILNKKVTSFFTLIIVVSFLYHLHTTSAIIMKLRLFSLLSALFFSTTINAAILSVHCPYSCPENPEGNDLIFNHIYALSNNPNTKFADWVAYEVNPINYGVSPGRDWGKEPLLDENETLEEKDYKGANKSVLEADRGHQAPLATFAGSRYWYEANYLSNITPQNKDLNQGPWKALEDAIRDAATYEYPLYVITGPTFDKSMPSMPGADEPHQVPSGYFKIVYDRSGGVAFLMGQDSSRNDDYCEKTTSFSNVEKITGITLPKMNVDSKIKKLLGCR